MTQNSKRSPRFLLLMPDDIRDGIERAAKENNRPITAEINMRLRISLSARGPTLQGILAREAAAKSLPPSYTTEPTTVLNHTKEKGPAPVLTDLDRAMLAVFHSLPVEKQLALLSLFR